MPRTIAGMGSRLAVDRVTSAMFNEPPDPEYVSGAIDRYGALRDEMFPEGLRTDPTSIQQQEHDSCTESFDALSRSFILIGRGTGDKCCNEALTVLLEEVNHIADFLEKFQNMECIRQYREKQEIIKLDNEGFKLETRTAENGMYYKLYFRDPVKVLQSQIEMTLKEGLITDPSQEITVRTHPMNSDIGVGAVPRAKLAIEQCIFGDVSWRTENSDGEKSSIGLLQVYSDKSQTSLNSSALTFYPMHLTLQNFNEEWRKKHIQSGKTVVAFLPVSFEIEESGDNRVNAYSHIDKKKRKKAIVYTDSRKNRKQKEHKFGE